MPQLGEEGWGVRGKLSQKIGKLFILYLDK
jgi:hypothetical protein